MMYPDEIDGKKSINANDVKQTLNFIEKFIDSIDHSEEESYSNRMGTEQASTIQLKQI